MLEGLKELLFRGRSTPARPIRLHTIEEIRAQNGELQNDVAQGLGRDRRWRDADPVKSISHAIGEENARAIEEILSKGGTVMDVGAGGLVAALDLTKAHPHGQVIAVEPFPSLQLPELPSNLRLLPKKVDLLLLGDLADGSVDAAYSAYSFAYIPDKLKAISVIWDKLRVGGKAYIHLWDSSTTPDLEQILKKFNYSDCGRVEFKANHPHLLTLNKSSSTPLNFGKYRFEGDFVSEEGVVFTRYYFDSPN